MSGRSVNLTTPFLGRLRPPKRLTSTSCIYFHQRKEKRKYVARPGIESRTSDLRIRCPTDCATVGKKHFTQSENNGDSGSVCDFASADLSPVTNVS